LEGKQKLNVNVFEITDWLEKPVDKPLLLKRISTAQSTKAALVRSHTTNEVLQRTVQSMIEAGTKRPT